MQALRVPAGCGIRGTRPRVAPDLPHLRPMPTVAGAYTRRPGRLLQPAKMISRRDRMTQRQNVPAQSAAALPPDDLGRTLALGGPAGENPRHIGVVGDTYTILL